MNTGFRMIPQFLKDVVLACQEAGRYLMDVHRTTSIHLKGSNDLVTTADRGSEEMLVSSLRKLLPEASVLTEEAGRLDGFPSQDKNFFWVIDPLDGTVNYSFQIPFFCVSVALFQEGEPLLGVVHAPALQELYVSQKGKGSFLNGERLNLRQKKGNFLSLIATSAGMTESDFRERTSSYHPKLLAHYSRLRLMGSQALHLCFVAAGRLQSALTNQAKLWDDAAGALILKEAYGTYSDFQGHFILPLPKNSRLYQGTPFESIGTDSPESLQKIIEVME